MWNVNSIMTKEPYLYTRDSFSCKGCGHYANTSTFKLRLYLWLLPPVPKYGVYCYARYQSTVFIVTPGTKVRCLLLRPVPKYGVYCYARYQSTVFIVTPCTKVVFIVTPGTKVRCLLLRPVPKYCVYCYARY